MQTSPYLTDVNWDAVYEKKMEAGFVPNVSVNQSCIVNAHMHMDTRTINNLRAQQSPASCLWKVKSMCSN